MVEFALIAPLGFFLLISIVVVGIVITNFVQLTNMAREGARIAAICGSNLSAQMPDGSGTCSVGNIDAYITNHLVAVPAGFVSPQIYICNASQANQCTSGNQNDLTKCQAGKIVEVDMTYDQPLYLPLVSTLFETKPNGTRSLTASAQATCEQ